MSRIVVHTSLPGRSQHMPPHTGEVTVSPTVTTDAVTITTTVDLEQMAMRYVLSNLQGSVLATADHRWIHQNLHLRQEYAVKCCILQ
ncbi:MAG: hypothetical protein IJ613_04150 [Muribaculaceae bacterium]|nr:hypothetical protein [Muribaculaceae bacterium]